MSMYTLDILLSPFIVSGIIGTTLSLILYGILHSKESRIHVGETPSFIILLSAFSFVLSYLSTLILIIFQIEILYISLFFLFVGGLFIFVSIYYMFKLFWAEFHKRYVIVDQLRKSGVID